MQLLLVHITILYHQVVTINTDIGLSVNDEKYLYRYLDYNPTAFDYNY